MEEESFEKGKLISHWLQSSNDDFETMLAMYDAKRYSWSLFIGHLMMEKLLKAYFVSVKSEFPPFIHNLLRLAEKSGMILNEEEKFFLVTVTAFNINARYDDYKMSFQKKCTAEFTFEWVTKLKEKRKWMLALIS